MKLSIAAIGHGRNSLEQQLVQKWFSKLPQRGSISEAVSKLPQGQRRQKDEADRLFAGVPAHALLIALDGCGNNITSEDLAKLIQKHRDEGRREAVFVIGGADGHHPDLLNKADGKIAFGQQTWPHLLCRAMLAEQLYRAEMILMGHPYHHG